MPSHFSHPQPEHLLYQDGLPNADIAIQASVLIAASAKILECVLRLAAVAMSETATVTEVIRSLQRNLNEHSRASVPLTSVSNGVGLKFLQGVAGQAAQASLDIYKLVGETGEMYPSRQWLDQVSGDSICTIQRRLRKTLEPLVQSSPSRRHNLPEQMLQARLTVVLNVAMHHVAVANTALRSVERYNVSIRKIVRAIERGQLCEVGQNSNRDRK